MEIYVREAVEKDLDTIAKLGAEAFKGHGGSISSSKEWSNCWFRAFPMYQYYVAIIRWTESFTLEQVIGFVGWQVHGGFNRAQPVLELEQIAIDVNHRGQNLAPLLIEKSFLKIVEWMKEENSQLQDEINVIVWGYSSNLSAMRLYLRKFTDGVVGTRLQYGDDKVESMLRYREKLV